MNKRVSILIAAYNIEQYMPACLDSCIKQTYNNIEIVVVNDGSTDGTGKIIDSYAETDNRIVAIHKSNGGLVSARKSGIENASSEFVFFLDGDDTLPENAIECLINAADENTDIVVANYNIIDPEGKIKVRSYGFRSGDGIELINKMFQNALCNVWGNLFSLKLFDKIVFPIQLYKSIGEDLVTIVQLAYYSTGKIRYIEQVTYNYLKRDSSIIGKATNQSIWALGFGAFSLTTEFVFDNQIEEKIKKAYLKLMSTYVTGYIVSNVNFNPYKNDLKSAINFAIKNWKDFSTQQTLFVKVIFRLAFYNLYISRLAGKFALIVKHLARIRKLEIK